MWKPAEPAAASGKGECDNLRKALANSERSEAERPLFGRAGIPVTFDVGISQNANGEEREEGGAGIAETATSRLGDALRSTRERGVCQLWRCRIVILKGEAGEAAALHAATYLVALKGSCAPSSDL